MKKIIFVFVFIFVLMRGGCAQDSVVRAQKFKYGGMQQLGFLVDESGTSSNFVFINGIRYRKIFMGIGADISFNRNYYYRNNLSSAAVFLDTRYYINKKKNFFVKADGGVNFLPFKLASNDYTKYKKKPGVFALVGLGFKARIGKEVFYSFDLNYGIRQTRYDYSYKSWDNQWRDESYDFRRPVIVLNMGIEIF